MGTNALTPSGHYRVSDYLKMADFMEAQGKAELATDMRALAQQALDSGDTVIKPEHIEAVLK